MHIKSKQEEIKVAKANLEKITVKYNKLHKKYNDSHNSEEK